MSKERKDGLIWEVYITPEGTRRFRLRRPKNNIKLEKTVPIVDFTTFANETSKKFEGDVEGGGEETT